MPTLAHSVSATGSWNAMPNAKISFITSDRYSLTLAWSWICSPSPPPVVSKLRKNVQATGNTK